MFHTPKFTPNTKSDWNNIPAKQSLKKGTKYLFTDPF